MKKSLRWMLGMLFLICCMLPARPAQAAESKRLCTIVVNDGYVSQNVPVYQYTENNQVTYVAVKKSMRTLPVYSGASKVSMKVTKKTAFYKDNYSGIKFSKNVKLSSSLKNVKLTLTMKDGSVKTCVLKLSKPAMPKVSTVKLSASKSKPFVSGNYGRMAITIKTNSSLPFLTYYKIRNSSGKVVEYKELGTQKSGSFTEYWDGTACADNEAGLKEGAFVPAGEYKLTAYIRYTVGNKVKNIGKTKNFVIKSSVDSISDVGDPEEELQEGSAAQFQAGAWNWKVTLTGDETIDYLAETVCKQVLKPGMTELQRAKALYTWCGNKITYGKDWGSQGFKIDISSSKAKAAIKSYAKTTQQMISQGKAAKNNVDNYFPSSAGMQKTRNNWALAGIGKQRGDCLIMSLSYEILCRHAGLTVNIVENDGKAASAKGAGHHFWNVVKIGSSYYYTDVNQATSYKLQNGSIHYAFFLRGTDYYYQHALYNTVQKNSKYKIADKVSNKDCPGV